jgi:hypothetical protein
MSVSALIKKYWLWAGLVLLCAMIAYAAFVAPSRIGQLELEREARTASARIGAGLKGEPSTLPVLTIPVHMTGQPDETLLVYLDQSEQAAVLSRYFGLIAAITMLLLGAGVATPIALAWMRSQERRQAEARVRYLQNHDR